MVFPKEEFNKASVKDANLNKGLLVDLFNEIDEQQLNIHSMMLLKSGSEVFHASAHEYDEDTKDEVYSVSKSFTSIAIGILIDMNLLNLEDIVLYFFKNEVNDYLEGYETLKLKHLLTMSTGQEVDAFKDLTPIDNPYQVFFNTPLVDKPGETFRYSNIATFMLSAIVTKVTGKSLNDFLNEYLYKKIGMEKPIWNQIKDVNFGAIGLQISCHDMARFGLLLANEGKWGTEQIISKEYLDMATTYQISTEHWHNDFEVFGYGFQFWLNEWSDFRATGMRNQHIIINKEHELVFVVKAFEPKSLVYLFKNYILEAAKKGYEYSELSLRDFTRRFKIHSHDLIESEHLNREV